jgi:transposase
MDPEKGAIQLYHERGYEAKDIAKELKKLKVSRGKVYRVCGRLKRGDSVDNRHRSGRRPTVRTPEAIKRVREQIRRNLVQSGRKMAPKNKMSVSSIQRIIKYDIGLRPYKKGKLHGLTIAQKKKRLARCGQLLRRHASGSLEGSDKKIVQRKEAF